MTVKEKEIHLKLKPKDIAFLKSVLQASENIAFMRVEDDRVRILTTGSRFDEVMGIIKSLKEKIDFEVINP